MINPHGITLIALAITIIILLILAGVVLNLTLGEHGIIKKAEQAGEQYKISEILEKLELEKVDLYARKNGEAPSLQEYIDHLINKGIITSADVTDIDASNKNIAVEGYLILVEKEASGNIKITYVGKDTKEPRIANVQVTGTTIDSISVKVVASNANGSSYKYSIKNVTLGETSFTLVTTLNTNEYTFTGLTINNDYIIQVELVTSEGTDTKETSTIKTEPPKVTTITLDKTNIEIAKGGTDVIIAEVLPENALDKTITWTSSNEAVVTVDNSGNIEAVGEGEQNTYAGISFEYVNAIITSANMNNTKTNANGWGACVLRNTLNSTTINTLENQEYIKQVNKSYIAIYNDAGSVTISQDRLWLLSTGEIWGNSQNNNRQHSICIEGGQYKYYVEGRTEKKGTYAWLRSPAYDRSDLFLGISMNGGCGGYGAYNGSYKVDVYPGFSI